MWSKNFILTRPLGKELYIISRFLEGDNNLVSKIISR